MVVQTAPKRCSVTSNPTPLPVWQSPVGIPATASVYECDVGVIRPGRTRRLTFDVVKNPDVNADDDLTFRADVIGEITLSDGMPLWFPVPAPRGDGITDRANNYTIDAIRARVVGYNLLKSQLGICSENNPPPASPDSEVQIGEECEFHIESGGWFGFNTPGFTYIAVQDIQVIDQIPDGQGYLWSNDPLGPGMSTAQIQGVSLNPPPLPLAEDWFDWTFNTDPVNERITVKDHWFRVDVRTRLLTILSISSRRLISTPATVATSCHRHSKPFSTIHLQTSKSFTHLDHRQSVSHPSFVAGWTSRSLSRGWS